MKQLIITFLLISLIFSSCEKKKRLPEPEYKFVNTDLRDGLPENEDAINGYFYFNGETQVYSPSGVNTSTTAFAIFNDEVADLIPCYDHKNNRMSFNFNLGNVSVNDVLVNGARLLPSSNGVTFFYNTFNNQQSNNVPKQVKWKTAGNTTFTGIDLNIAREMPVVKNTYVNSSSEYSLSVSKGYQLKIEDNISNYDSLIVTIGYVGQDVTKKSGKDGQTINFTSSDLSIFSMNTSVPFSIKAFNYSNKIENNKIYVFELSSRISSNIRIYQ